MSCTSARASTSCSFSCSARATSRAICATSMVWVSRERKWSLSRLVNTCVLPASRRNDRACTIRWRSYSKADVPSRDRSGHLRSISFASSASRTARARRLPELECALLAGSIPVSALTMASPADRANSWPPSPAPAPAACEACSGLPVRNRRAETCCTRPAHVPIG